MQPNIVQIWKSFSKPRPIKNSSKIWRYIKSIIIDHTKIVPEILRSERLKSNWSRIRLAKTQKAQFYHSLIWVNLKMITSYPETLTVIERIRACFYGLSTWIEFSLEKTTPNCTTWVATRCLKTLLNSAMRRSIYRRLDRRALLRRWETLKVLLPMRIQFQKWSKCLIISIKRRDR